jgi:16S rRNA (cytosine967-C5)-methyltransferase
LNTRKPREIAFSVLNASEGGRHFVEEKLAAASTNLSPLDRSLCQELVFGVTRWRATLDYLIHRRTQGRPQKTGLYPLLRLGLYQLLWLSRIPDHAAVFETVELARQAGFGPQSGFVNALLRHYVRERDATRLELEELRTSQPALGWSHPEWLVHRWFLRWRREEVEQLLEWNNQPADIFARANTLRLDVGALLEMWRMHESVDYDFFRKDWTGENLVFRVKSPRPFPELHSFRQGGFYLQDPSTLLPVTLLDPQPQERILDLCAAPGGKTTYIAQRVNNEALIVARDSSERRLKQLKENCARLGATCVDAQPLPAFAGIDTTAPDAGSTAGPAFFDRVLIDAPCSNTGVIRRRLEVRWRVTPDELLRLQSTQLRLLEYGARQLRLRGVLVYSTCSIEPEENRMVVDAFLRAHPEFELETDRELFPFRDKVDGAYAARIIRTSSTFTSAAIPHSTPAQTAKPPKPAPNQPSSRPGVPRPKQPPAAVTRGPQRPGTSRPTTRRKSGGGAPFERFRRHPKGQQRGHEKSGFPRKGGKRPPPSRRGDRPD